MTAFEVLCKTNTLLSMFEGLTKVDSNTPATKWVEWWMRPQHLKLLHKNYAEMEESAWERCLSDTI